MLKKDCNKYFYFNNHRKVFGCRYLAKRVIRFYYDLLYMIYLKRKVPDKSNKRQKKYKVSICAIFKNEGCYLKEWIEYHMIVGVEHFYLYNNFSEDNYMEVLKPYINNGVVTLENWPIPQGQIKAYEDCITKRKGESDWIGFIDLDEFVVPVEYNSIAEFLNDFENYPTVKIYWKVFGTSGKIDRDRNHLVIEDFTACWDKYDETGKSFYNTQFDFDSKFNEMDFCHDLWGNISGRNIPPVNCFKHFSYKYVEIADKDIFPIQINHYYTKSLNEYLEKASRGDAYFVKNPKNMNYFYWHENRCNDEDCCINKYMNKLKERMGVNKQ